MGWPLRGMDARVPQTTLRGESRLLDSGVELRPDGTPHHRFIAPNPDVLLAPVATRAEAHDAVAHLAGANDPLAIARVRGGKAVRREERRVEVGPLGAALVELLSPPTWRGLDYKVVDSAQRRQQAAQHTHL